ncbi:hypothetical protein V1512DRAFT_268594 [Lipomyces arxii]|uniref:uncharacterized protein n=1 Tax=Lipomyces arxii TaxID=56418 RepID=UPI0034CE5EAB
MTSVFEYEQYADLERRACISCPSQLPTCPSCADDEQCQLTLQTCSQCPMTSCVKRAGGSGSSSSSSAQSSVVIVGTERHHSGPNIGAIVGGTVGGIVVAALIVVLFFYFRRRRRTMMIASANSEDSIDQAEKPPSRTSRHSIASSAVTRASNVIPIAYIPGVINRSNPNSPSSLVPPIPELPAEHSNPPSPSYQDAYGVPSPVQSNLRNMSIYSGGTYDSQADHSIRDSIDIRDSVMTSVSRGPALMTAIRAKPSLVGEQVPIDENMF